jgi:hypothetical protein
MPCTARIASWRAGDTAPKVGRQCVPGYPVCQGPSRRGASSDRRGECTQSTGCAAMTALHCAIAFMLCTGSCSRRRCDDVEAVRVQPQITCAGSCITARLSTSPLRRMFHAATCRVRACCDAKSCTGHWRPCSRASELKANSALNLCNRIATFTGTGSVLRAPSDAALDDAAGLEGLDGCVSAAGLPYAMADHCTEGSAATAARYQSGERGSQCETAPARWAQRQQPAAAPARAAGRDCTTGFGPGSQVLESCPRWRRTCSRRLPSRDMGGMRAR